MSITPEQIGSEVGFVVPDWDSIKEISEYYIGLDDNILAINPNYAYAGDATRLAMSGLLLHCRQRQWSQPHLPLLGWMQTFQVPEGIATDDITTIAATNNPDLMKHAFCATIENGGLATDDRALAFLMIAKINKKSIRPRGLAVPDMLK